MENRIVLELPPSDGVYRSSEGSFATLTDGRVLLAYSKFTGGYKDDAGAVIVSRVSCDGGLTWSGDTVVAAGDGTQNVMSASLARLADGRLALMYLAKNGPGDCRPRIRFGDESQGGGHVVWGEPVCPIEQQGYFVVNNDRLVQLRTGRLVMPAAAKPPRPEDPGRPWLSAATFYLSDDAGRSWRRCAGGLYEMPQPEAAASWTGLQEPGVIELADGTMLAWARTDAGCQFAMTSADGGETWTPPARTGFVSPVSPMSLKRIAGSGLLLALWNDHSGRFPLDAQKGRQPLVSAVSRDEGRTWENHKQVESDLSRGYHYTAIHFLADGHTLLGYCAGPKGPGRQLNTLRIRRLSTAWWAAGEP